MITNESVQRLSSHTRFGHSTAVNGDSMFIYGGTSERSLPMEDLLEFKFGTIMTLHFLIICIETQSWSTIHGEGHKAGALYGHTTVVYDNYMYISSKNSLPYSHIYSVEWESMH